MVSFISFMRMLSLREQKWKKRRSSHCRPGSMASEMIWEYTCLGPQIMRFVLLSGVTAGIEEQLPRKEGKWPWWIRWFRDRSPSQTLLKMKFEDGQCWEAALWGCSRGWGARAWKHPQPHLPEGRGKQKGPLSKHLRGCKGVPLIATGVNRTVWWEGERHFPSNTLFSFYVKESFQNKSRGIV